MAAEQPGGPPSGPGTLPNGSMQGSEAPPLAIMTNGDLTSPAGPGPMERPPYQVGDLVWSKLSGYPWWPCMVSEDPIIKKFNKRTAKGIWQFHCQFFGQQAERGWVNGGSVFAFQGREAFESYGDFLLGQAKSKSQRKALQLKFEIKPSRRPAWEVAVLAAEQAAQLDLEERKARYTFLYTDLQRPPNPNHVALGLARGVEDKPADGGEGNSVGGMGDGPPGSDVIGSSKVGGVSKAPGSSKASSRGRPKGSVNRPRKTFQSFLEQRSGQIRLEHPDWTPQRVESYLQCEWDQYMAAQSAKPSSRKSKSQDPNQPRTASRKRSANSTSSGSRQPKKQKGLMNGHCDAHDESDSAPEPAEGASAPGTAPCPGQPGVLQTYTHELEVKKLSSRWACRKEAVCAVCRKTGDTVQCKGVCRESFHAACANVVPGVDFKCQSCLTGVHTCFLCSQPGGSVRKCSHVRCGKFYHDSCLNSHPLVRRNTNNEPICPCHVCASCADGDPDEEVALKGQFFNCALCPNSYHVGDFCLPAGSKVIASATIVCSAHFEPKKGNSQHNHVNVNSCFSCDQGGHLMCCEACPASYHAACADLATVPTDQWLCHECSSGRMPRYGDIVWVKCGRFRWWPCEVIHSKNLPDNIRTRPHSLGEFAVFFFGSHDYLWTNRARVYRYVEEDMTRKHREGSGMGKMAAKLFERAIPEAMTAFKRWKAFKEEQVAARAQAMDKRPAYYKHITVNYVTPGVVLAKSEMQICSCKPANPCDSKNACLNRAVNMECSQATCPMGADCQNVRFQQRHYPKAETKKFEGKGWGLVCKEDIKAGAFVNEYVGEIITAEESNRRLTHAHATGVKNYYMFTLDKNCIIDAGPKGNLCRFMNNSCQPNCETQKWTVNSVLRIGLFALRDIAAGEELTFNYHFEYFGQGREACHCGTPQCCGILGGKPKVAEPKAAAKGPKKAVKKAKKRKRVRRPEGVVSEDECFRCGDGGDLVICDNASCPKAYHLACLQLTATPKGKWVCPWHHCDKCGGKATTKCHACPDSYCAAHAQGKMQTFQGLTFCHCHNQPEMEEVIAEMRSKSPGTASTSSVVGVAAASAASSVTSSAPGSVAGGETSSKHALAAAASQIASNHTPATMFASAQTTSKPAPMPAAPVASVRGKSSLLAPARLK